MVERSGKNIGGYRGETIDIQSVLQQIEQAAARQHWAREADFLAWLRPNDSARARVYLSTGIHGDEPAGPLAALQLLQEDIWPAEVAVWLLPLSESGRLCAQPARERGRERT